MHFNSVYYYVKYIINMYYLLYALFSIIYKDNINCVNDVKYIINICYVYFKYYFYKVYIACFN